MHFRKFLIIAVSFVLLLSPTKFATANDLKPLDDIWSEASRKDFAFMAYMGERCAALHKVMAEISRVDPQMNFKVEFHKNNSAFFFVYALINKSDEDAEYNAQQRTHNVNIMSDQYRSHIDINYARTASHFSGTIRRDLDFCNIIEETFRIIGVR